MYYDGEDRSSITNYGIRWRVYGFDREFEKKNAMKATIQRYTTLDYGTVGRGARARASREANGIRIHSEMMATSKKGRIERH